MSLTGALWSTDTVGLEMWSAGNDWVASSNDTSRGQGVHDARPLQSPTKSLCRFHVNGGCTRGNACPFSHDLTVNATTAADASRGFVLTGQVVNLKQSNSTGGATSSSSVPLCKAANDSYREEDNKYPPVDNQDERQEQHSTMMNPSAVPFVSTSLGQQRAFPDEYQCQQQQHYPHHPGREYHHQQSSQYDHHQEQHDMYGPGCGGVAAAYGNDADNYHRHYEQPSYDGEDHGYGSSSWSQYDYDGFTHEQRQKWTPSGVFTTTADNPAMRSAIAGYYDQYSTAKQEEFSYQQRRMQALRPPLQHSSRSGKSSGPSSDASFSEEEARDRAQVAMAPSLSLQQPYGSRAYFAGSSPVVLGSNPKYTLQSAEAHRRLRNRGTAEYHHNL